MNDPRRLDRRRRALAFAAAVGLAIWAATTGIIGLLHPPRWLSALLVLGALGLTVWGALLSYRREQVEEQERLAAQKAARDAALDVALPAGLRTVADTDPYQATLVERSLRAERYGRGGERPPYVERDDDDEIRRALLNPAKRLVLLQGPPRAGKGRSMFEAVAGTIPDHWLVIPGSFDDLKVLGDPWSPCPPGANVVLWLNDLRDFVRPGGLPSGWLDRWAQTATLKVVALGVDEQLEELRRPGEIHQGLRDTLARFEYSRCAESIDLAGWHSDRERGEILRLYPEERVRTSLGDHLVTADRHLERLRAAKRSRPAAYHVVASCALAQHLTRQSRVDQTLVRSIFRAAGGTRPLTRGPTMEDFETGIRCMTAGFHRYGGWYAPLLQQHPRGTAIAYSTPHYVVEEVLRELFESDPTAAAGRVPDTYWTGALNAATVMDLLVMGLVAYDAGHRDRAELAWARAMAAAEPVLSATAAINLAELERELAPATDDAVQRSHALGRALELLESARQLGSEHEAPRADRLRGDVLAQLGAHDQAAAAYQVAISSGHVDERPRAAHRAGLLRLELGDSEGALELLTLAADSDHYDVAPRAALDLARLLRHESRPSRPDDQRAAADALVYASRMGGPAVAPTALRALADLHLGGTDHQRAREPLVRLLSQWKAQLTAADLYRLGGDLNNVGAVAQAEEAYEWAIAADDATTTAKAALALGMLRLRPETLPQAEEHLRLAVKRAAGTPDEALVTPASCALGFALRNQGDVMGAVEAYETAARARRLHLPGLIRPAGDSAAFDNQADRSPRAQREQEGWRQLIATQLVETLSQVIDDGPANAIPDAAARLVHHHALRKDQRALKAVLDRVNALSDRAVADQSNLNIVPILQETGYPKVATTVWRSLAGSPDPSVAAAATEVLADLEKQLRQPPPSPAPPPTSIPPQRPVPPPGISPF
jgi:hypothetical protein